MLRFGYWNMLRFGYWNMLRFGYWNMLRFGYWNMLRFGYWNMLRFGYWNMLPFAVEDLGLFLYNHLNVSGSFRSNQDLIFTFNKHFLGVYFCNLQLLQLQLRNIWVLQSIVRKYQICFHRYANNWCRILMQCIHNTSLTSTTIIIRLAVI